MVVKALSVPAVGSARMPEGEWTVSEPANSAVESNLRHGFDDLYRDHYKPMVMLARGLVDLPEIAEDIVQDAFAKLFDRWNRLDNPGGYLRTTVVNSARSELRKRYARRRIGLRLLESVEFEEQDYLLDALDKLPPRQKAVLVLKFYEGMSEKEIARTIGVRPGTVKSATSRGLAELRKVIER